MEPAADADARADSALFLVALDDDFLDRVERVTGLDLEEDHLVECGLEGGNAEGQVGGTSCPGAYT